MDLYKIRQELTLGTSLSSIPLRVTHYSRVSTTSHEQASSLENQKDYFENFIKENGNWKYIEGYIDNGITGTSDIKRDNFMKMITDAKKNKFDLIITKEISRFSRNTLDSIKYTRLLLSYGVAVLFINDNINTALSDSELRLTIMASLAQDEIRRLSERVKFGMASSIKKGNILGNNKLYGYKQDKINHKYLINKEEAKIVQRIYILYAINDLSLTKISKILTHENIKTQNNRNFTASSLSRLIKNIKYKGYYCGKKTEVENYITKKIKYLSPDKWIVYKDKYKIPQLVSDELWNKANLKLKKLSKHTKRSEKKYLYSSLLVCKDHTTSFYRRISKSKDITYLCSTYLTKGKSYCNTPIIREIELTSIIKDIVKNIDMTRVTNYLLKIYHLKNNISLQHQISQILTQESTYKNIVSLLIKQIVVSKNNKTIILNIKSNYNLMSFSKKTYGFYRRNRLVTYHLEFN